MRIVFNCVKLVFYIRKGRVGEGICPLGSWLPLPLEILLYRVYYYFTLHPYFSIYTMILSHSNIFLNGTLHMYLLRGSSFDQHLIPGVVEEDLRDQISDRRLNLNCVFRCLKWSEDEPFERCNSILLVCHELIYVTSF